MNEWEIGFSIFQAKFFIIEQAARGPNFFELDHICGQTSSNQSVSKSVRGCLNSLQRIHRHNSHLGIGYVREWDDRGMISDVFLKEDFFNPRWSNMPDCRIAKEPLEFDNRRFQILTGILKGY